MLQKKQLVHNRTKYPIKRSKLEMDIIARNVAHNLQNLISNRKVEINIKSLPAVTADPGMMQYVFGHLLSNAIKFTQPRKNARIEISGYRQGDVQLYSVEDYSGDYIRARSSKAVERDWLL